MDFLCIKRKGEPVYDPAVAELKRIAWEKIPDGKTVNMAIIVPKRGKSWKQVKLIWGNMVANTVIQAKDKTIGVEDLMKFLLADGIPKGQEITADYIHQIMYITAPTTDVDGNKVTLSQMDTQQASSLFKRYQAIMAGIGIIIDDPPKIE